MIPPIVRRCPECGHVALRRRFAAVTAIEPGRRYVECPACGSRVDVTAEAWRT